MVVDIVCSVLEYMVLKCIVSGGIYCFCMVVLECVVFSGFDCYCMVVVLE